VLYVLDNPQKRDTDVRISPFLRDRELSIRDKKHRIVIKEPVSDWSRATESVSMITRQML